jgi:hypothetical protein
VDRGSVHVLPDRNAGCTHRRELFDVLHLRLGGFGDAQSGGHQQVAGAYPVPWIGQLADMCPLDRMGDPGRTGDHPGVQLGAGGELLDGKSHDCSSV